MENFRIENITFTYPERDIPALKNVTLSVAAGEFITFCGPSGCGKTTFLRQLKPILAPHGKRSGTILFQNKPVWELSQREQAENIGFVTQSADNQLVTDKVWHELAFGLESLGMDNPSIRLRVSEMASFFGIENWFYQNVSDLSGGQKQIVNLAAVMVMQPSVLILDEPTGQLDPIAASDFLATIGKINRELGVTILMTEHRLEEVFPLSDRVVCMDQGAIICVGTPSEVGEELRKTRHGMFCAMPTPMRVYAAVTKTAERACPITIRDGRSWLSAVLARTPVVSEAEPVTEAPPSAQTAVLELDEIWFRYEKDLPDVLKGMSLQINEGDFLCMLGGNGTGKTTSLSILCGANKPYRGKVRLYGRELNDYPSGELFDGLIGALPQNPQTLFVKKTVCEDLMEIGKSLKKEERTRRVMAVAKLCEIEGLLHSHPFDLSGGEQQRAALAKVLLMRPRILLLDEPTKAMDAEFKLVFAGILKKLNQRGITIFMISHDIEFCAEHAKRCAFLFDGGVVSEGAPKQFFGGNSFYTTQASRMTHGLLEGAVTANDVIAALNGGNADGGTPGPDDDDSDAYDFLRHTEDAAMSAMRSEAFIVRGLPLWRKAAAALTALLLALTVLFIMQSPADFVIAISGGSAAVGMDAERLSVNIGALIALCAEVVCLFVLLFKGSEKGSCFVEQTPLEKRKLSKRTKAAMFIILFSIPLTLFVGTHFLDDRKYYFISMLIILQTLIPFVLVFEGRKPQTRELVIIAVLCAIGVASRVAFFMLPQFKPVVAMVIIAAVAFGAEVGFFVGAATVFVSNMYFGQGTWTVWQMFSMGIIGFLAGVLFRKGILLRGSLPLCIFGGLATFVIYGGIMNASQIIMLYGRPTWQMFLLAQLQGIPFDLVHAAATVTFLAITARPMLEKLDRIKVKYGLVE